MKKVLALVLAALIVCALPVMAFAADSPKAEKKYTISVQKGNLGDNKTEITVEEDNKVTVKALDNGTFNGWKLYVKKDTATSVTIGAVDTAAAKYVEATEGVDYKVVSGSLKTKEFSFIALTDLVVCGNYDGYITDPQTGDATEKAPQTGANTAMLVVICVLALAGAGVATKKVLA